MSDQSPHILICRLSHIGDCVLTIPMVEALRQGVPGARISWAMESPTHKLLDGHPAIDEIILVPRGWLKSPSTIREMRRTLRQRRFDISVDPQSILKSALLARLSGARVRLGFGGRHGREGSTWLNNCQVVPRQPHLLDRSLELVRPLVRGLPFQPSRLPTLPRAESAMAGFLAGQSISDRFVVINPGASWPSKRWETDRFAAVARQLESCSGIPSVVTWSGDEERAMAGHIVEDARGAATMAPPTSLPELAALLKLADLFVGCDTGPLHMAAACGTVCVGLYGPTRPQDSGAWGPGHFALQTRYQAGTCRQRRSAQNQAMREIDVAWVVDACLKALHPATGKSAGPVAA